MRDSNFGEKVLTLEIRDFVDRRDRGWDICEEGGVGEEGGDGKE
jgi:hypothetical protein